jgi:hypothetical protein
VLQDVPSLKAIARIEAGAEVDPRKLVPIEICLGLRDEPPLTGPRPGQRPGAWIREVREAHGLAKSTVCENATRPIEGVVAFSLSDTTLLEVEEDVRMPQLRTQTAVWRGLRASRVNIRMEAIWSAFAPPPEADVLVEAELQLLRDLPVDVASWTRSDVAAPETLARPAAIAAAAAAMGARGIAKAATEGARRAPSPVLRLAARASVLAAAPIGAAIVTAAARSDRARRYIASATSSHSAAYDVGVLHRERLEDIAYLETRAEEHRLARRGDSADSP